MMKLIEIFTGGKPSAAASKKPKIAVVYAVGPIVEGKSDSGLFGSSVMGSTSMIAAIKKAADDPKVVAIVLRIDSPGGSATASDLIWRETVRIKKPIIASMGDVAGSGGYYIAMGAKKIYAAPCTLTGSIGVIGGKLVTRGLYGKLGPEHRGDLPRRQQRRDVVRASRSRPASGRSGSNCCKTRTTSSSARPPKAGR